MMERQTAILGAALTRAAMSQTELAEACGVSPQAVTNWVRGYRPLRGESLARVVKALHLEAEDSAELARLAGLAGLVDSLMSSPPDDPSPADAGTTTPQVSR